MTKKTGAICSECGKDPPQTSEEAFLSAISGITKCKSCLEDKCLLCGKTALLEFGGVSYCSKCLGDNFGEG